MTRTQIEIIVGGVAAILIYYFWSNSQNTVNTAQPTSVEGAISSGVPVVQNTDGTFMPATLQGNNAAQNLTNWGQTSSLDGGDTGGPISTAGASSLSPQDFNDAYN